MRRTAGAATLAASAPLSMRRRDSTRGMNRVMTLRLPFIWAAARPFGRENRALATGEQPRGWSGRAPRRRTAGGASAGHSLASIGDPIEMMRLVDPIDPSPPVDDVDLVDAARRLREPPIAGEGLVEELQQQR